MHRGIIIVIIAWYILVNILGDVFNFINPVIVLDINWFITSQCIGIVSDIVTIVMSYHTCVINKTAPIITYINNCMLQ